MTITFNLDVIHINGFRFSILLCLMKSVPEEYLLFVTKELEFEMPTSEKKEAADKKKTPPTTNASPPGISKEASRASAPVLCKPTHGIVIDTSKKPAPSTPNRRFADSTKKVKPKKEKPPHRKRNYSSKLFQITLIILLTAIAVSYFKINDKYSVETKLTFVPTDIKGAGAISTPREMELLKHPNVVLMTAQNCLRQARETPVEGAPNETNSWDCAAAAPNNEQDAENCIINKFAGTTDFINWLNDNLVVESSAENNVVSAGLRLQGDDPEFLKTVLNSYVKSYSDYRRSVREQMTPSANGPVSEPAVRALNDELQKVVLQQKQCDLTLRLISSRKGVFRGFIPDSQLNGIPSLANFQQRIVELEIKKRSLSVRYTPKSREIQNVDFEIKQIREVMKDCITEHLYFLQQSRELLLAQKSELEKRVDRKNCPANKLSGVMPGGEPWFSVADELRIIQEKPRVSRKPIRVKAGELKTVVSKYMVLLFDPREINFFFGPKPNYYNEIANVEESVAPPGSEGEATAAAQYASGDSK